MNKQQVIEKAESMGIEVLESDTKAILFEKIAAKESESPSGSSFDDDDSVTEKKSGLKAILRFKCDGKKYEIGDNVPKEIAQKLKKGLVK